MNTRILIVEDDIAIARLLTANLEIAGYETREINNGLDALVVIEKNEFDLVLLDVMLPGMDGFELIKKMKNKNIPVIFLTAKNNVLDKVKGLKLGAEDYMVKPFEAIELIARIETVLRRYGNDRRVLIHKNITVNIDERIVKNDDNIVDLSHKEFELLTLLLKNKNIALSREQILSRVWAIDYFGGTRTVDMHIKSLRKKLDLGKDIKTVYKVGYRLEG